MYKIIFNFLIITTILGSCKSNKAPEKNITLKDTFQFAPIIELLNADADDVIKTPYFLYSVKQQNGVNKKDSSVLSREQFSKIIQPITSISITTDNFKEISFEDLSTQSISFITTAKDTSNKIKSITTLLNSETKKLKNIFVIMNFQQGDTIFRKQYFWKAGKSLTISTIKELPSKKEIVEKEFINWNDKIE
jgi:hypothetical protein